MNAFRNVSLETVASPNWTVAPQYEQTTDRANRLGARGALHWGHMIARSMTGPFPGGRL